MSQNFLAVDSAGRLEQQHRLPYRADIVHALRGKRTGGANRVGGVFE